jgi:ribosomal protein S27AE
MADSLKSGVCPKCDGNEVYFTENEYDKVLPHEFGKSLMIGGRPSPVVDNFVCGNCGYIEFFVRPRYLAVVKKNWDRMERK